MSHQPTLFNPQKLQEVLSRYSDGTTHWVGFSGGADSTALLHALHELTPEHSTGIKALHINHGIQAESDDWEVHCRNFCQQRNIEFLCLTVNVNIKGGSGPEAEARKARYSAVEKLMAIGDIFLTAHHREDQAETLLLNLMRGSGIDGLAGMPETRPLGRGILARPLLGFPMQSLRDYLLSVNVPWLEDPSNTDESYDRNFVRHQLLPLISRRWPGASDRIARSALLSRHASENLAFWADEKLEQHLLHPQVLNLRHIDPEDPGFSTVTRQWLRNAKAAPIPLKQLDALSAQILNLKAESKLRIAWSGWVIQAFNNCLWLQDEASIAKCPNMTWDHPKPLDLGSGLGSLRVHPAPAQWLEKISVSHRNGGESLSQANGSHHKALKDILREAGIPHWLRSAIPLISGPDGLLAVGDMAIGSEFTDWLTKENASIEWSPTDPVLTFVHEQFKAGAVDPA
jgi:tRNA(Ile)-lysidine synthase